VSIPKIGEEPVATSEASVPLTSDSIHDLAGPINQIGSLTDLILKKYGKSLDEDAHALFYYLHSSADRLQNLLAGMRRYMQVAGSPGAFLCCDGNALLAEALGMLQYSISESAALITHDPLPELCCDANQVRCALANLIENSIKFRDERTPEIHVGAILTEAHCVLSVRDNGLGIGPRYADRIFRTFKRIHNDVYPGAGVGLAIVKHVAERHGGRVWVESEPGQGATFFLEVPRISGSTASSLPHSRT
jgi:light-regulated signal transduction histidine kinase (bacteriophytochrome)